MDEDDVAFKEKKKQEEAALKAARDKGMSQPFYGSKNLFNKSITASKGMFRCRSGSARPAWTYFHRWVYRRCSRWRDQEVSELHLRLLLFLLTWTLQVGQEVGIAVAAWPATRLTNPVIKLLSLSWVFSLSAQPGVLYISLMCNNVPFKFSFAHHTAQPGFNRMTVRDCIDIKLLRNDQECAQYKSILHPSLKQPSSARQHWHSDPHPRPLLHVH